MYGIFPSLKVVAKELGERTLRGATLRASSWVIGGYVFGQALRLGTNLVVTRLLVPEAFGLMALVNCTIVGLQMFSDVGLRGAIIHSDRGDQDEFLNTAWTIQVVRGFLLWAVAAVLAWPISIAFGQPLLAPLLVFTGMSVLFGGFRSIMFFVLQRRLEVRRLVILEVTAQFTGLAVMIGWAITYPSVWALAGGPVVGTAFGAALSYIMLGHHRHKLTYDTSVARYLFHFGKWIFLNTLVTFIIGFSDRFVIGGISDVETLGLFAIAVMLATFPDAAIGTVVQRVLFPTYSLTYREGGSSQLRHRMRRFSGALYILFAPSLLVLVAFGDWIVHLLYDPRYAAAGPMLAVIAAGMIGKGVTNIAAIGLLATGDSKSLAVMQALRLATFAVATAVGIGLGDTISFLIAIAVARWVDYIPASLLLHRAGLWNGALDVPVLAASGLTLVLIAV